MPAQSGNNISISQIKDGLINPGFTSPLYVSANSFTVAGDVTSWLRPGREVILTFQTSGVKRCIITSLSYDSGMSKTTINVVGDSLVNETITSVLLASSDTLPNYTAFFNSPPFILQLSNKTASIEDDIDISSYVPVGTTSVLLMIHIKDTNGKSSEIFMKGKCQSGTDIGSFLGQVAFPSTDNRWNKNMGEIPVGTDRKLHYWLVVASGGNVYVDVRLEGYRVAPMSLV